MLSITNALRISCTISSSRNILKSCSLPLYNQNAGVKTLEEKIGLPPRPKKPLTPYFRYMKEQRPIISSANPKASIMEVVKIIATKWDKVDDETKKKFQNDYKTEQISYVERRAKYDSKITDEQRTELKQAKIDVVEAKERKAMKKRVKDLGRPKKPSSAFLRFIAEERTVTPQPANQTYREWHKRTTEKWGRLTDAEKDVYVKDARKEIEKYKKEISKWEEKMIRMGNIDVVRHDSLIDPTEAKYKQKIMKASLKGKTTSPKSTTTKTTNITTKSNE